MNLAVKDIQHNVGRFALTTLGIGLLLMIVMGMGGIYRGLIEDATLLVESVGADLWVVQRDTRGPFAEISRVPSNLPYRVRSVPGVATAREFVFHTIQREHQGKPLRMSVMGLSWPVDHGRWISLIAGRPLARNHFEMIVDRSLGLKLGESLRLGKETYTVVGITRNMVSTGGDGMIFVTTVDAQTIQFDLSSEAIRLERAGRELRTARSEIGSRQPALVEFVAGPSREIPSLALAPVSAVLVSLESGASLEAVQSIIDSWADVTCYTKEQQNEFLLRGMVEKARRQLGMFRVLLTIIAAIIMALIIYTLTLDKLHAIALLKLIGTPNGMILGLILQQAILIGSIGYLIAYGLGTKLFPLFPRRVILQQEDLIQLAVIVIMISILASMLAIWKALRVSPGEALN